MSTASRNGSQVRPEIKLTLCFRILQETGEDASSIQEQNNKKSRSFDQLDNFATNCYVWRFSCTGTLLIDDRRMIQIIGRRMENEQTTPTLYGVDDLRTDRRR